MKKYTKISIKSNIVPLHNVVNINAQSPLHAAQLMFSRAFKSLPRQVSGSIRISDGNKVYNYNLVRKVLSNPIIENNKKYNVYIETK